MITIRKIVFGGGDRDIMIEYQAGPEYRKKSNPIYRVASNDEPSNEFLAAVDKVVYDALAYFDMELDGALHSIDITDGDEPGSRVIIDIGTAAMDTARMSCPKVLARDIKGKDGEYLSNDPMNRYNAAVEKLLTMAAEYAIGRARKQIGLFDEEISSTVESKTGNRILDYKPAATR